MSASDEILMEEIEEAGKRPIAVVAQALARVFGQMQRQRTVGSVLWSTPLDLWAQLGAPALPISARRERKDHPCVIVLK